MDYFSPCICGIVFSQVNKIETGPLAALKVDHNVERSTYLNRMHVVNNFHFVRRTPSKS